MPLCLHALICFAIVISENSADEAQKVFAAQFPIDKESVETKVHCIFTL